MSDKEHIAIQRLQEASQMSLAYYEKPLVITDSGGKDSSVCKELAVRAGIPFEILHSHTTADAPETVRFVRQEAKRFEDTGVKYEISYPVYKGRRTSMWDLIPKKLMPPTRIARYCCAILKETGGAGRFICTGVRWQESSKRAGRGIYEKPNTKEDKRIILNNDNDDKRMLFENCRIKAKRIVNPIVDWKEDDVWAFLDDAKKPVNPLYAEGFCRVGCVGCPMAGKHRETEFARWPKFRQLYISAFDRMLEERKKREDLAGDWKNDCTGVDVFNWWMENGILPGQISWFDEEEET